MVPLVTVDDSGLQAGGPGARVASSVTELVKGSNELFFSDIPPALLSVPTATTQVPVPVSHCE